MRLYRIEIEPLSPWRTPWQSDTLAGLLCWTCARHFGSETLRRTILDPAGEGTPPFVTSDAFPGEWLPLPASLRLLDWPAQQRKTLSRARWISSDTFRRVQEGKRPAVEECVSNAGLVRHVQSRNSIGRSSNTTAGGGSLFAADELLLAGSITRLGLYVRLATGFEQTFLDLMALLAQSGFGADVSVGRGQFQIASSLDPIDSFDDVTQPDGFVVLSTFQPECRDPSDGCWETFTKYGKLGPDFGLQNVFKRPLVLFRPGACFRTSSPPPLVVGTTIPMDELLPSDAVLQLRNLGAEVCHYAFGLCVPFPIGAFHP